jgi:hypothetical protein
MRTLIAIKSCVWDSDRGAHQAILETWGKDVVGADLLFFVGYDRALNNAVEGTVQIPTRDDYEHLQHKTHAILRWSIQQGYDYTFLADNDTFLIPERLMKCHFENYDYFGLFETGNVMLGTTFTLDWYGEAVPNFYPWASGGYGYFVSRKAAEIVVATDPGRWTEDMYVGQSLGPRIKRGIAAGKILGFQREISWHYHSEPGNFETYNPASKWMQNMYEKNR